MHPHDTPAQYTDLLIRWKTLSILSHAAIFKNTPSCAALRSSCKPACRTAIRWEEARRNDCLASQGLEQEISRRIGRRAPSECMRSDEQQKRSDKRKKRSDQHKKSYEKHIRSRRAPSERKRFDERLQHCADAL